jgi:hypothetical protein
MIFGSAMPLLLQERSCDDEEDRVTLSEASVTVSAVSVRGRQNQALFHSSRSLRIKRLIVRPFAILFGGIFLLKAEGGNRSSLNDFPPRLHSPTSSTTADSKGISAESLSMQQFHPSYRPGHLPPHLSSAPGSDPQTLGWEPNMYPDPKYEPHKCGIAYLLEDKQYIINNESLHLCDPDWVLGGVYLEEIAISMTSFMNNFSSPPEQSQGNEKLVDDYGSDEDRGDEQSQQQFQYIVDAAASNDVGDQQERPYIELGVATVRKVRHKPSKYLLFELPLKSLYFLDSANILFTFMIWFSRCR